MNERRTLSLRVSAERTTPAPRLAWNVSETRRERLKEMARAKRRNPTDAEKALWAGLAGQKLAGLKFHRQVVVGSTIVDFACPARWLVVEIDDGTNREVAAIQDKKLTEVGIRVLRFPAADLLTDTAAAVSAIAEELKKPFDRRAERAANAAGRPLAEATPGDDEAEDQTLFDTAEEVAE
ncbi:MAG: DUF559 domain-containing protein [Croceibacterium sp.]